MFSDTSNNFKISKGIHTYYILAKSKRLKSVIPVENATGAYAQGHCGVPLSLPTRPVSVEGVHSRDPGELSGAWRRRRGEYGFFDRYHHQHFYYHSYYS